MESGKENIIHPNHDVVHKLRTMHMELGKQILLLTQKEEIESGKVDELIADLKTRIDKEVTATNTMEESKEKLEQELFNLHQKYQSVNHYNKIVDKHNRKLAQEIEKASYKYRSEEKTSHALQRYNQELTRKLDTITTSSSTHNQINGSSSRTTTPPSFISSSPSPIHFPTPTQSLSDVELRDEIKEEFDIFNLSPKSPINHNDATDFADILVWRVQNDSSVKHPRSISPWKPGNTEITPKEDLELKNRISKLELELQSSIDRESNLIKQMNKEKLNHQKEIMEIQLMNNIIYGDENSEHQQHQYQKLTRENELLKGKIKLYENEITNLKKEIDDIKMEYEYKYRKEIEEVYHKYDIELRQWKYQYHKEEESREKSEMIRIRLEEKLLESTSRIEEWKHLFLLESNDHSIERSSLLDRIGELENQLNQLRNH